MAVELKETIDKRREKIRYAFFPYMYGMYPYAYPTKKTDCSNGRGKAIACRCNNL